MLILKIVTFCFLLVLSANALSPSEKHPGAIPRSISVPDVGFDPDELDKIITAKTSSGTTEKLPGYTKGTDDFSDVCGNRGNGNKIVGGNEVTPHSYPWMAALYLDVGSAKYFCGGTLISDHWVMTAAHCTQDAKKITVYLGAHNITESEEEGRLELEAEVWFQHEDWSPILKNNDIALIQIPPVEFSDNIKPICLPKRTEADEKFDHLDAPASGWGKPKDSASGISDVLREVTCETITNLACIIELFQINKNNICISGAGGKSVCNGDSGGPLHLVREDGRFFQIGITSFGSGLGCELGIHAAFTRTTSFLDWIETNTNVMIEP